jgi:hypothetical protein
MISSNDFYTTVTTSDDIRITALGKMFRRTKIDELPQLFNVLLGQMSFVGPRPDVPGFADLLGDNDNLLLSVKPGITGWAQVNGRNALSWEEKFKLDVWYVDNRSLWLDLKILAMTASNASCPTSMIPLAVAIRVVLSLSDTSTIFGLSLSSRWVNSIPFLSFARAQYCLLLRGIISQRKK